MAIFQWDTWNKQNRIIYMMKMDIPNLIISLNTDNEKKGQKEHEK